MQSPPSKSEVTQPTTQHALRLKKISGSMIRRYIILVPGSYVIFLRIILSPGYRRNSMTVTNKVSYIIRAGRHSKFLACALCTFLLELEGSTRELVKDIMYVRKVVLSTKWTTSSAHSSAADYLFVFYVETVTGFSTRRPLSQRLTERSTISQRLTERSTSG